MWGHLAEGLQTETGKVVSDAVLGTWDVCNANVVVSLGCEEVQGANLLHNIARGAQTHAPDIHYSHVVAVNRFLLRLQEGPQVAQATTMAKRFSP